MIFPATIFRSVKAVPGVARPSSLEIKLVTSYPGTEVTGNTSDITARTVGVMTIFPGAPVDYNKLISFVWHVDGDGITAGSEGVFASNLSANTSNMVIASVGTFITAKLVSSNTSNMAMGSFAEALIEVAKSNWIAWSDVRSLDFTKSKKNVAGDMALDWTGTITNIKKIGPRMVVAGENGVSFVTPAGRYMGLNTVHRIGLLGRDAYAGNDFIHFFADKLGVLYQIDEILTKLDYREYLSTLTNPVFSLDMSQNILYMCDGTYGYAYSLDTKSLGKCAPNITGMGYKGGVLYPAAPASIVTPATSLITDIYDFGTRKIKTIYLLEFGTDLDGTLQAAIESRFDKSAAFTSSAFKEVSHGGKVKIISKGVEFRFKLKGLVYEDFDLDDFTINGKIHVH